MGRIFGCWGLGAFDWGIAPRLFGWRGTTRFGPTGVLVGGCVGGVLLPSGNVEKTDRWVGSVWPHVTARMPLRFVSFFGLRSLASPFASKGDGFGCASSGRPWGFAPAGVLRDAGRVGCGFPVGWGYNRCSVSGC